MKKISLVLVFILCLISFQPVFATGTGIELSPNYYDDLKDAFVIRGVLSGEIGNVPMSLKVTYGGTLTGVAQTVATQKDGEVCFEFPPVYFSSTAPSGDYTISVGSLYHDGVVSDTFRYCGADRMFTAMQQVQAVKNGTTSFDAVFASYNDALQIDYTAYTGLTTSKSAFTVLMGEKVYSLPSGVTTEADCAKVKEVVKQFRDDVSEAVSICEFTQLQTADALKAWITKYDAAYHLGSDNVSTPNLDESVIYNTYFKPVMNETQFLSRIPLMQLPASRSELKDCIYEMALLTNIEVKTAVVVKNIFETFGALFPTTQAKKDDVYAKLASNRYLTYIDAAAAYDLAAQPNATIIRPVGGGGGGGGGGSSSWGGAVNDKTQYISAPVENNNVVFHDLGNAEWAQEAILALYEKKIIAGDGSGRFLPQNHITRSEFLKMILLSCGISVDTGLAPGFVDVSPSSWYAPYVATAKSLGIIQGGADGRFLPDAQITRQDMIVMLYRAEQQENGGNFTFADQDDISDYAKSAVSYYAEKGIVSGMGDNRFEPNQLSTRAQAAQLIYNIIR